MIFAKSGGITLQEHIQDCLQVSKELKISLTKLFEDFGFNDLLTLAILFHDFGKLYPEFQKVLLKKDNKWENQRHEIYSVIFSNKIKMNKDDRALVQKAILSHHKSFDKLREKHLTAKELQDDFKDIWQSKGEKHHPKDVLKNLSKFRKTDLKEMIEFIVSYLDHENINYSTQPVIYSEQKHPIDELVLTHKAFEMNSVEFFKNLLFSGLLKMCDHYGSAKIDTLPNLRLSDFNFLDLLKPFYHQTECWQSSINTILIAPTGSGKTECALGWLKQ